MAMRKANLWCVRFGSGLTGPRYYVEAPTLPQAVERAEGLYDTEHPDSNGGVVHAGHWGEVYVEESDAKD